MKKQVIPTAAMIQAAKDVLTARAESMRLRPIINRIQAQLLNNLKVTDEDGEEITDPKRAFLMHDSFVEVYYPALNAAYHANGFQMEADFCPLLLAEEAERQAVRKMNRLAVEMIPVALRFDIDSITKMEDWHKLTGLNLAYISQFFGK